MRRFILAAVIAIAAFSPAMATDAQPAAPAKPICGKTVAECQKSFDDRGEQIARLTQSVQNMQQIVNGAETLIGTRALNEYFQSLAAQGAPPK